MAAQRVGGGDGFGGRGRSSCQMEGQGSDRDSFPSLGKSPFPLAASPGSGSWGFGTDSPSSGVQSSTVGIGPAAEKRWVSGFCWTSAHVLWLHFLPS